LECLKARQCGIRAAESSNFWKKVLKTNRPKSIPDHYYWPPNSNISQCCYVVGFFSTGSSSWVHTQLAKLQFREVSSDRREKTIAKRVHSRPKCITPEVKHLTHDDVGHKVTVSEAALRFSFRANRLVTTQNLISLRYLVHD
jgi:hypothetical protein